MRRVHVDLEDESGEEVADLRPADEDRMTRGRTTAGDHQLVARLHPLGPDLASEARGNRGRRRKAVVVQHDAARVLLRDVPIREVPVHGGDAAWILELAKVVEGREAPAGAELLLKPVQELRVLGLSAAALAQELTLQRVDGVDVVAGPGSIAGVTVGQVGIDARDIGVDVPQDGLALLAVPLQHVRLL
jgi:hypothetical protein